MKVDPISGPFRGRKHPLRYRFHKYWARKPSNVIKDHILHYTDINDVVLDPFCGSGISVAEAVISGRKAIGIDINPQAVSITKTILYSCPVDDLLEVYERLSASAGEKIEKSFSMVCPDCQKKRPIRYRVLSSVAKCQNCGTKRILASHDEKSARNVYCLKCGDKLLASMVDCDFENGVVIDCSDCGYKGRFLESEGFIPLSKSGLGLVTNHRIMSYPQMRCGHLFTKENWKYLNWLKRAIFKMDEPLKSVFLTILSATSSQVSRLIPYRSGLSGGGPAWTVPGFWVPRLHIQLNVWRTFSSRFRRTIRAIGEAQQLLGRASVLCADCDDVISSEGVKAAVLQGDCTVLPLGDESVDYVITDPPYGDSVPYLEFSQIWNQWTEKAPDYDSEIVISNAPKRNKTATDYGRRLKSAFCEIGRVLKNGHWATVFFQNRKLSVWNHLKVAASAGGLVLKAVSLHYPAVVSAKSQLVREGSLTGDLVLQFQKCTHELDSVCSIDVAQSSVSDANAQLLNLIIDTVVAKNKTGSYSFDSVASDVLVEMWRQNCSFSCDDIGLRIMERINCLK